MNNFRIGRHINSNNGFLMIPEFSKNIGCGIFQIFLGSPQRIISKMKQKNELVKFGKKLGKQNLEMIIHGSYTINLCHPTKNKKFQMSLKSLVQDLNASEHIGNRCLGVIIHMGKNIPENNITNDEALDNYVIGLKKALEITSNNTNIILETGASQGSEVASKIDGLSKIYWKLNKNERDRIYFCVDTCHIWATGYDISVPVGVKQFFKEFEKKIGIAKIICIHFNNSKTKLESHVDRHADLNYGFIKINGLRMIAKFAQQHNIPLITETPLDSINPKTNKDITFEDELLLMKSWLDK